MVQIIPNQGGGGGGGGGDGDMKKSVYDPNNVNANAFDYNNFINTPTIPAAQVQSDWDEADNTQVDYIKNKPVIPTVNNSTIEIQKNGTKVEDFTLNQASGETINITVPTDTSDLTNGAGFVTSSIISDTAYGSGWDADTTHAPSKNAVYDKLSSMDTAIGTNTTNIGTINGKIPSEATSTNKLADKNYVNDGINSVTAYYITKNANGDQFATYAELSAATTFYSGGVQRTPTRNDYTIVLADENHDNATTRYIYNSGWEYQYTVNETALSQAQLDALNSGITSGKVSTYDGYASTISGKQDALTLPATPTQGHLVTRGADNESLTDGGAIPTGVPAVGTDGQVLTVVSGVATWASPTGGIQEAPNSPITGIKYVWRGSEAQYQALSQYYTDTPGDTEYHTF